MVPAQSTVSLETCRELDSLPLSCDALFAAEREFSLGKAWFRTMVAHGLPPGYAASFHLLVRDGEALALLPLQAREHGPLRSLTNPYTSLFRPLIAASAHHEETARLLGREIGRLGAARPLIRIDCLPSDWPGLDAFAEGVQASGLRARRFCHFGNWVEPLRGRSFEDYLAARPGSLREVLRRRGRRAKREGGITFEIVRSPRDLPRAVAAYESVYRRSWKEEEPFPRFNPALMEEASRLGALRLGLCWRGERAIAAQLWIVSHGSASVMKLAHDEAYRALSPGTLLTAQMIAALLEEGVATIDFGRGDDPYKRLWAGERRQRIGLILANPRRPAGLLTLFRHDLGRMAKSRFRRERGGF